MNNSHNTIPSCGQEAPTHPPRLQMLGLTVLAVLLYLVLVDAAVESFVSHSPLRWIICGAVAGYVALSVLLWRKLGWTTKASVSFFVLFSLLAFAAWRPAGSDSPLTLLRQPTSTLLSAATILGILLAGWVLGRFKFLPWPARVALLLLAAYGVAGFVVGIMAHTPYAALLHGGSLWEKLPFWLQGAFLGGLVVLPAALVLQLVAGVSQIRAGELRDWGRQVLVLGLCAIITASGIPSAAGPSASTAAAQGSMPFPPPDLFATNPSATLTPEQAKQAYQQRVSAVRDSLNQMQATLDSFPKKLYDLDALGQSLTTPQAAFEYVRDQVAMEPYPGVLKGATGAFLTHGANDLDRCLLLAAVLTNQNIRVKIAHGKLAPERAKSLWQQIAGGPDAVDLMQKSLAGFLPNTPSAQSAQAQQVKDALQKAADSARKQYTDETSSSIALLQSSLKAAGVTLGQDQTAAQIGILQDHYWVQATIDNNTVDLDPSFSNSTMGQKFTEASESVDPGALPDDLNQTMALRLVADYLQDGKTNSTELLNQKLKTVDLWGKNIRVAVVPASDAPDANDFQPVLLVGENRTDGQAFQLRSTESGQNDSGGVDTGAKDAADGLLGGLGGEEEQAPAPKPKPTPTGAVLGRLYFEMIARGPHLPDDHSQRVIVDRLESAQDKLRLQTAFADDAVVRPLLTQIWDGTIGVGACHPLFFLQTFLQYFQPLEGTWEKALEAENMGERFDTGNLPGPMLGPNLVTYLIASDLAPRVSPQQQAPRVRRYYVRARLAFVRHGFVVSDWSIPGGPPVYREGIDLMNLPFGFLGPRADAPAAALRSGVSDTVLEHAWSPTKDVSNTVPLVQAALQQKVPLMTIKPAQKGGLDSVSVPASIRAILNAELLSGHILVLPSRVVQLDGRGTFGWWSVDPSSGYAIGKMEFGGAQGWTEYKLVLKKAAVGATVSGGIGLGRCFTSGSPTSKCLQGQMCASEGGLGAGITIGFGGYGAFNVVGALVAGLLLAVGCQLFFG